MYDEKQLIRDVRILRSLAPVDGVSVKAPPEVQIQDARARLEQVTGLEIVELLARGGNTSLRLMDIFR